MFGKKKHDKVEKPRKLELERRTLRTLDTKDLAQVAGGRSRGRGTVAGEP